MNMFDLLSEIKTRRNAGCEIVNMFSFCPTGSAHTCDPPVLDTDEDWVVWAEDFDEVLQEFIEQGFQFNEEQLDYNAASLRNGRYNIILLRDEDEFTEWAKATAVCKYLNISSKEQRKMVHRIVCGEEPL